MTACIAGQRNDHIGEYSFNRCKGFCLLVTIHTGAGLCAYRVAAPHDSIVFDTRHGMCAQSVRVHMHGRRDDLATGKGDATLTCRTCGPAEII